jgi:RHS repeat-associated protein
LSPTATKLKATFRIEAFGAPVSGSAGRYGWLGGKQRRAEFSSGVIQMGVRSYVPALGRFLTPDPVPGESANAYDYAGADPLNSYDLEGTTHHHHIHEGGGHGHLHVSWTTTRCVVHEGCDGEFTVEGTLTERYRRRSVMHVWVSVDNPTWSHAVEAKDFEPVRDSEYTPSYSFPLWVPFGTTYTVHLYWKAGNHHSDEITKSFTAVEKEINVAE